MRDMNDFTLHSRLESGSFFVGRKAGCQVLLKDNACFPWLLIVPEVPSGVEDLHQLEPERYTQVLGLLREVSEFVADFFQPDKLNVACLGNQVRQMHLHVVGRREGDATWPNTVWASDARTAWEPDRAMEILTGARAALGLV